MNKVEPVDDVTNPESTEIEESKTQTTVENGISSYSEHNDTNEAKPQLKSPELRLISDTFILTLLCCRPIGTNRERSLVVRQ